MIDKLRLSPDQLSSICRIEELDFTTTEDLEPLKGIIGQERAVEALAFGLNIKKKGYNVYISGISGTGRSSYANSITEKMSEEMPIPDDWVYVYNFKNPDKPNALNMEAGLGRQFKKDIEGMIDKLKNEISLSFQSTEYETLKTEVIRDFQQNNQRIIEELNSKAKDYGFLFKESEQGLVTIPLIEGRPMKQEEYTNLSQDQLEELREKSNQLNLDTLEIFNQLKTLEEDMRDRIKKLDEKTGYGVISFFIQKLIKRYGHRDAIVEYINQLEQDIVEHISWFNRSQESGNLDQQQLLLQVKLKEEFFTRYKVNLFIDNKELKHAPIINETNPNIANLLGFVEYRNEMGVLKTDFMQIKPGALHMANGGFLILNIREVLTQPHAWETLKRALKNSEISIESLNKTMGYIMTTSIKPEAIPLDIKVILVGDPYLYRSLYEMDEDFKKLFKIMADFDIEMERDGENVYRMAQFITNHCENQNLRHFDKAAVARIIEYSSRLADHQGKLSSRFSRIVEVLYEADAWAEMADDPIVSLKHIEKAIEEKIHRNSKYEEKLNDMIAEGDLLIDVDGSKIGQINGLAVMGTGEHSFGKPSRITVSTYRGKSGIISIEREIQRSGSIHHKGVLILSGYLGSKFAQENPLSLAVSISFEQNYSIIDGDSASSTELYAILSSIAEVPIKQYIAVTGSVNQKGEIQPIGGVNEKIEGFFDICKLKGLTGQQGVMIPKQNVKNLMLKKEVIDAVKEHKFHIYSIGHVDEGIEILTGIPAGVSGENGEYPEGTINYLVSQKLKRLAENIKSKED
ncbi:Lon protease family protein [Alkaliphilus serpentinus]|uniref:endopeptidase La n=1 Tax=Alkaliphilus serpentinus TaxID=1482731 RepID=A0A833HRT7_9FIRM|nr:ATP-binding protein [Alkaliphilus serpentinus]KAB3533546.1 AAA family ATPase [Alkaliphilus serpentinus]